MINKVVFIVSKDVGGTEAVLPVGAQFLKAGFDVRFFADDSGRGVDVLDKAGVKFTIHNLSSLPKYSNNFVPDFLISSMCDGASICGAMVAYCKDKRVLTFGIEDYWGQEARWDEPVRPDYLFVNDKIGKDAVLKLWQGYQSERIIVSGYPALDKLAGIDIEAMREDARDKLGLVDPDKLVLFTGQMQGTAEALEMTVKALLGIDDSWILHFRPHPKMQDRESVEYDECLKLLGMLPEGRILKQGLPGIESILATLGNNGCLLTIYSTTAMQASAMRIPNISVLSRSGLSRFKEVTGGIFDKPPVVSLGCSAEANSIGELKAQLKKVFSGELAKELMPKQQEVFKLDGNNAERVANKILEIVSK